LARWLQLETETWRELSRLIDTALELPAAERAEWLASIEDAALRERVRGILARSPRVETSEFLARLPALRASDSEAAALAPGAEIAGDSIGPYRLVRELGTGGMSAVWLAERTDGLIRRPVALKLPQGVWRRGALAQRFASERDILAALTHPNIARLYDAGVSAGGQPYLAIEFVEGQPLDVFCTNRDLGLRARLRLFLEVARAVAYAHTQLIVHRDLKPANILVTAAGDVRLLDFGIAKLLDPDVGAQQTELAAQAFTPDYAAPEQIAGQPVTTATDVYSLGVLLYELTTLVRPYRLAHGTRAALEQAIASTDPVRPSVAAGQVSWRRDLRGDIDTIVLKALKKLPEERYATVSAFADDIDRFLADRPVLARPDSVHYRVKKFVRRNRALVAGAAVLFVAMAAGAGMSLWQAGIARAEARRAEEIKEFLASTIRDVDPHVAEGRVLSAADLLRQALGRAEGLGARPELSIEMRTLIAQSMLNLEDFDAAEEAARQALAQSERTLGPAHEQTLRAREVMVSVHRFRGRIDHMRRELDEVEKILATRARVEPADRYFVLENRAHLAIDAGEWAQATRFAKQALELAVKSFGERDPRTGRASVLLAEAYEYDEISTDFALAAAERAFRLTESIHGSNARHPSLVKAREIYGRALGAAGQLEAGIAQLQISADDAAKLYGPSSSSVALLYAHLARYELRLGKPREAVAHLDQAVDILGRISAHDSFNYLSPLGLRGVAYLNMRDAAHALPDIEIAERGYVKLFGPDHEETVIMQRRRAHALGLLGRTAEARAAMAPVLQAYRTRFKDPLYLPTDTFLTAGIIERMAGSPGTARGFLEEALTSISPGGNADRFRFDVLAQLALADLDLGDAHALRALDYLQEADGLRARLKVQGPRRADVLLGLGRVHLALKSPQRALEFLRKADEFWRAFDAGNRWAGEAAAWHARALAAAGQLSQAREAAARARPPLRGSPLVIDAALLRALPR
jgi:eukaryotic-like serine/threonine-protein kinase